MVRCVKVAFQDAERVKQLLEREGALDKNYRYGKDATHIYFPVTKELDGLVHTERELARAMRKYSLRERLAGTLSKAELGLLTTSYDVVGSIAILEIDERLSHRERLIAEAVLATHKQVRTVLKKEGGHEGELRLQRMRCLAGEDTRETIVRENGVRLKINVEQVYYSVRTATERKRIAALVRPGERVLVLFSGAAPYPCVIAKLAQPAHIVGVELNPVGHRLGLENIRLNKFRNITLYEGDVREVVPRLAAKGERFDRIVMPLPHTGHDFLDEALRVAKEGTVIHLYDFEPEGSFELGAAKARAGARRHGWAATVRGITACGQHSPRVYRICVDFSVHRQNK